MEIRKGLATFGNILIVIDSSRREEICGRVSNCKVCVLLPFEWERSRYLRDTLLTGQNDGAMKHAP